MLNTYEKGLIIDAFAGGGGASVGIEMAGGVIGRGAQW